MKKVLWGLSKFSIYLISYLPFPILYLVSDFFYYIIYYIVKYRRHVVEPNLRNSFPEKTEAELKVIEKKFYRFLCDNILESFKMLTISRNSMKKRLKFLNPEEAERHFHNGRSVLATGGHYANWEWGNLAINLFINKTVLVVYKPLGDKLFGALLNKMRSRFGTIMVPMKHTLRKIAENRHRLYFAVFVSDQTPTRHESNYFTEFLNQRTSVFLGIEKIAKTTGNPVVFCYIDRIKRGYYEARFKTIVEDPKETSEFEITEIHTKELEQQIKARPELWLWSHKRWKFKSAE
ncbi:lysophospholipid acyltransferase family protein [Desertivirga xinjiangensis]|uniref:lysophospholipid acyltransferase family protein n=1 Tax=Desertivirga xinjiangensis TaxID=539206 RepID=UPI00210E9136|nr:lysophospholipid acyltransferase family protein [Pedobacter xinjiangensis]